MSTPIWDDLTGEQGDPTEDLPAIDLDAEQAEIHDLFAPVTGADGGTPPVHGDALSGDHEEVSA